MPASRHPKPPLPTAASTALTIATLILPRRARGAGRGPTATLLLAALLLSGCGTLRTVNAPVGDPEGNSGRAYSGLHYFLPRGIVDITGAPGANDTLYQITIARRNEADQGERYRLVHGSNWAFEDITKFEVDSHGLLTNLVDSSTESKAEGILLNVTDTLLNVGKIMVKLQRPGGGAAMMVVPDKAKGKPLMPFKVSFDPYDAQEVRQAVATVAHAGWDLTVDGAGHKAVQAIPPAQGDARVRDGRLSHQGIFYRPLRTVKIKIAALGDAAVAVHQNVPVPDLGSVAVYSVARGFVIKKEQKITFAQGEPMKVDFKRPSELLGITNIPKEITGHVLKALDEVPALGSLIYKPRPAPLPPNADLTARTARLKAEEDNLKAQETYLEQRKKTLQKSRELEELRRGTPSGQGFRTFDEEPLSDAAIEEELRETERRLAEEKRKRIAAENKLAEKQAESPIPPLPPVVPVVPPAVPPAPPTPGPGGFPADQPTPAGTNPKG